MGFRPDIAGLRAIAVVPVVLYHAGLQAGAKPFPGGFVGVDIFFVISGYLITRIITAELDSGHFSLLGFYQRRVRRILPALLLVLASSLLAGAWMLTPLDYARLGTSTAWAAGFAANLFFWLQPNGYFAPPEAERLLLHTWSLAVEEQFYLGFPLLLLAARPLGLWRRALLLGALLVVSLLACIGAGWLAPGGSGSFYLPQYRAWEFLVGALLTLAPRPTRRILAEAAIGAGLLAIALAYATIHSGAGYPGWRALLPVLGTGAVLWGGTAPGALAARTLGCRPLAWIGALSYSLYLWHWPVLLLWRIVDNKALGGGELAMALALTLGLSVLSYHLVEQPFRQGRLLRAPRPLFGAAGAATLALVSAGVLVGEAGGAAWRIPAVVRAAVAENERLAGRLDWPQECRSNYGLRISAPEEVAVCTLFEPARTGQGPNILLWGDSQTEQLWFLRHALRHDQPRLGRMLFATYAGCVAVPGFEAALRGSPRPERHCSGFNEHAMAIALRPETDIVVLGSLWTFLTMPGQVCLRLASGECRPFPSSAATIAAAEPALLDMVGSLRAAGKRVVLVLPYPMLADDPIRPLNLALLRGHPLPAGLTREEHEAETREAADMLRRVAARTAAVILDPAETLCGATHCPVSRDNITLYRDRSHLSEAAVPLMQEPLLRAIRAAAQDGPVAMRQPAPAGDQSR